MLVLSSYFISRKKFKNNETESNLLVLNKNEKFDCIMMGISHARNFSRDGNHQRIEIALNKKIINIGQGKGACGMNEQLFYLQYFYSQNNEVNKLIYFISPPLFYSESLPMASNTFDIEPFEIDFLWQYINFKSDNKSQRIWSYMQSKFHPNWWNTKANIKKENTNFLTQIDSQAVKQGQIMAYGNSISKKQFEKSKLQFENTLNLALKNKTEIILIIPPALFGKWQGHDEVEKFAQNLQNKYVDKIKYYNHSEVIKNPKLYYDHHHLNSNGVDFYINNYLKMVL